MLAVVVVEHTKQRKVINPTPPSITAKSSLAITSPPLPPPPQLSAHRIQRKFGTNTHHHPAITNLPTIAHFLTTSPYPTLPSYKLTVYKEKS